MRQTIRFHSDNPLEKEVTFWDFHPKYGLVFRLPEACAPACETRQSFTAKEFLI
jgi:hypothetical protein